MKNRITLIAILIFSLGFAQIPAGYYSTATGTGYTLKTQLFNKIKTHTTISYTPGLWNLYYTSDVRSDGKVWDIYSNCNFIFGTAAATGGNQDDGTGGTSECQKYNREHTFPKSWFSVASPMYSDAFIVMPADKKVNGLRGNLAYGKVGTATFTSGNGSKIGNCVAPGYTYGLQVFEPADEFKGDLARNYFYMATCYQDIIGSWQNNDADGNTVLDGSSNVVFESWYLNLMITWHLQDPVSQKEIDRNNAVYNVQGNRNPYIDHPEYVCMIWNTQCAALSNDAFVSIDNQISIYPNPSFNGSITLNSSLLLNKIQMININGQTILDIDNPIIIDNNYSIDNLPKGFYFLKITANNQSTVKKVIVE